jgi:ribosomal protein S18 acetylase RimI-like enzyme
MAKFEILPVGGGDAEWVESYIKERWSGSEVVVHGEIHYPRHLPGFLALLDGERVGLVTYQISGDACEIVTLDSNRPGMGIGAALVTAVRQEAVRAGCRRLWLISTNDNLDALRFYQKRGFLLVAIHREAVDEARKLKPAIPQVGFYGIPVRDEIELEMDLK